MFVCGRVSRFYYYYCLHFQKKGAELIAAGQALVELQTWFRLRFTSIRGMGP